MTGQGLQERQMIESLRTGVPSAAVVGLLGSDQERIEQRFAAVLEQVSRGRPSGLGIGGGFGAGKSHLLRHLGLLAHAERFVVSHVVISKETSFHDPVKVASAALAGAAVPGVSGPAIEYLAATLDLQGTAYAELLRWAASPSSGLDERFPASLLLFARLRDQYDEFADTLVNFWSGEGLPGEMLRRRLREIGENIKIGRIRPADLARQQIAFGARLMQAAGYAGWVVLFDEVELIARYPLLSRAKAYAEVNRWLGDQPEGLPVGAVLALTDDFSAVVLDGRKDREKLPAAVRRRATPEAEHLARQAEVGMSLLDRKIELLEPPDNAELDRAFEKLRDLYAAAFGWNPPEIKGLPRTSAHRMRQYVRAWINEWDLLRLFPSITPQSRVEPILSDSAPTSSTLVPG